MPAALPADWRSIAVMVAHGTTLQEISDSTGISLGTLKARSAREGWKSPKIGQSEAKIAESVTKGQMQPHATDGRKVAADTLERRKESSRLSLSRYAQRALATAATLPRGKLLSEAANVKAVAGAYAIAHPEPAGASGAPAITLNVGFLLDCQAPGEPGGEIREVIAEVVREGENQ